MPSCSWHTLIPQIGNFSQLIEDWFVLAAQMGSTKMNAAAVIIRLNPTSVSLARPFCGVENRVPQLAFEFFARLARTQHSESSSYGVRCNIVGEV